MDNKQLKTLLGSIIPYLCQTRHKGQNGKIAVLGGSFEYTGAPYYSAISSIRGGADLCHIFCTQQSAIPIKTYSPECIVHPLLLSSEESIIDEATYSKLTQSLLKWLPSMHSLVIGPGLGRNATTGKQITEMLKECSNKVKVLDADSLWFMVQPNNELIEIIRQQAHNTILTPNAIEMKRFQEYFGFQQQSVSINLDQFDSDVNSPICELDLGNPVALQAVQLSQKLNNVCVIQKGIVDIITNGERAFAVNMEGSQKRCGGIGDILSGLTGLYGYWASQVSKEHLIYGCILASLVTRRASQKAFSKYQYSLSCPNVIDFIADAVRETFQSLPTSNL